MAWTGAARGQRATCLDQLSQTPGYHETVKHQEHTGGVPPTARKRSPWLSEANTFRDIPDEVIRELIGEILGRDPVVSSEGRDLGGSPEAALAAWRVQRGGVGISPREEARVLAIYTKAAVRPQSTEAALMLEEARAVAGAGMELIPQLGYAVMLGLVWILEPGDQLSGEPSPRHQERPYTEPDRSSVTLAQQRPQPPPLQLQRSNSGTLRVERAGAEEAGHLGSRELRFVRQVTHPIARLQVLLYCVVGVCCGDRR